MSQRFRIQNSSMKDDFGDPLCHWFEDNGAEISDQTACDLLNSQAETIEVLREWIRSDRLMIAVANYHAKLGNKKSIDCIAALEGK